MTTTDARRNRHDQPIGDAVPDWTPRRAPGPVLLEGRHVRLEPLAGTHAASLATAFSAAPDDRGWTYLPIERLDGTDAFGVWIDDVQGRNGDVHLAVVDAVTGDALGSLALLRADPANGVVEVGWVNFSPALQGTPSSTEAQALLATHVFDDLGYRRYEWKCDALNMPSRRAAERLGFTFEGVFRKAVVTKGRRRDTAWFSMTDDEWPAVRDAFTAWLDPSNVDERGRQRRSLAALRTVSDGS